MMADNGNYDDSEWEYEYDANEVEHFYLILDIPDASSIPKKQVNSNEIFGPPERSRKSKPKGRGRGRGRGRGALNVSANGEPADQDNHPDALAGQEETALQIEQAQESAEQQLEAAQPEIQLMDLHTENPLISYKETLYSCRWSSSVGSDLLFAKRPAEPDINHRALHSFDSWDLIGIGTARLMASPASLQRRQGAATHQNNSTITGLNDGLMPVTFQDENMNRQANFLTRFAEIKKRKGEYTGTMLAGLRSTDGTENPGVTSRGRGRGRGVRRPRRSRAGRVSTLPTREEPSTLPQNNVPSVPTPSTWTDLQNSPPQSSDLENAS